MICSAIDITERKLAELVIQKAREDLERKVKERSEELIRANEGLKAEILERKRFEATLQLANRKLNTLSSITRHDILNQITAIMMYVSLAEELVQDPTLLSYLKRIEQTTQMIQKQIRFARDYEELGISSPRWHTIDATISRAVSGLELGNVRVEKDVEGLEVYADMLLEKVFFNIVDNALRHGQRVTKIRFSLQETGDGITIFCEDNGVGVPLNMKEGIFKREFYRNTGYGLFLASEILGITGLTIGETGEPGLGARFEIRVPKGTYRLSKKPVSANPPDTGVSSRSCHFYIPRVLWESNGILKLTVNFSGDTLFRKCTHEEKISRIERWSPASGPLRGTAGHGRFQEYFLIQIRRGGVPSGAAAFILNKWRSCQFLY